MAHRRLSIDISPFHHTVHMFRKQTIFSNQAPLDGSVRYLQFGLLTSKINNFNIVSVHTKASHCPFRAKNINSFMGPRTTQCHYSENDMDGRSTMKLGEAHPQHHLLPIIHMVCTHRRIHIRRWMASFRLFDGEVNADRVENVTISWPRMFIA